MPRYTDPKPASRAALKMVVYMALGRSPEPVWFRRLTQAQALTVTAAQAPAARHTGIHPLAMAGC